MTLKTLFNYVLSEKISLYFQTLYFLLNKFAIVISILYQSIIHLMSEYSRIKCLLRFQDITILIHSFSLPPLDRYFI